MFSKLLCVGISGPSFFLFFFFVTVAAFTAWVEELGAFTWSPILNLGQST